MAALVQGHVLVVGSCLENPMDRERSLAGYSPCETHGFKQNIQLVPEQETLVTPGLGVGWGGHLEVLLLLARGPDFRDLPCDCNEGTWMDVL